ncbi:MAG: DsbA family protein [Ilumatobacteraceae bacterium]
MTTIEVYADVCCPFAHVGLRRLVERRAELGADAVLRVRAWPLELVNGQPMDGEFIGEEIDEIRPQVAADLFAGFRVDAFPSSSIPAMALVESAYAVGEAAGEAVSLAVRDALFEHGLDVGDDDVLAGIAERHGVPMPTDAERAAVAASWEEGRSRGVIGSPHFFTPQGGFFCPTLDIKRVEGHLRITADMEAFDEFTASCFEH